MKKINWFLISNVAVMGALIVIVIGFYVVLNKINQFNERLERLELNYSLIEQDYDQLYDIDPGIRMVD